MGTVTAPEPLMAKSAVCHSGQLGRTNQRDRRVSRRVRPRRWPARPRAAGIPGKRWVPSLRNAERVAPGETGARQWLVRSERGANRRSWARMNVPQGRTVAQYWQRARLRWQEILDPWRLSDISDREPRVRKAGRRPNWAAAWGGVLFSTAFGSGLRWGRSRAYEREHTNPERSRDQPGAISRAARNAALLQRLATGGGAAHAPEQPGPGRRGEAGGAGGLRRHGKSSAELGLLPRHREIAAGAGIR